MTNKEMFQIAMEQSALDINCKADDFLKDYCCVWSNLRSARTAVKSGFVPAWVEMTVKPQEIGSEICR